MKVLCGEDIVDPRVRYVGEAIVDIFMSIWMRMDGEMGDGLRDRIFHVFSVTLVYS